MVILYITSCTFMKPENLRADINLSRDRNGGSETVI